MKNIVAILAASLFATIAPPSVAGPATDALTTCLADNTTGKDRKDMRAGSLSACQPTRKYKAFPTLPRRIERLSIGRWLRWLPC